MRRVVVNLLDARPVWRAPDAALSAITRAFPHGWEVCVVREPVDGRGDGGGVSEAALAAVRGTEIYVGFGMPRELFLAATAPEANLRWVHSATAGIGSMLYEEMLASDVLLTNSAGVHAPPMAETVLGMILHFARGLDVAVRAQAEGAWAAHRFENEPGLAREVAGATLGIIGLGGIGREVAWRARALGMRVLAVRRRRAGANAAGAPHATEGATAAAGVRKAPEGATAPEGVRNATEGAVAAEVLRGDDALRTLLARSDYVVIAAPSTRATRGMIGARELGVMRADAVLINVARGDIVDEDALVDALRAARLRGAALDVFRAEPLPAGSPLWHFANVLITPHVSGTTDRFWERETALITDNVARYLGGRPLRNVVDRDAGY